MAVSQAWGSKREEEASEHRTRGEPVLTNDERRGGGETAKRRGRSFLTAKGPASGRSWESRGGPKGLEGKDPHSRGGAVTPAAGAQGGGGGAVIHHHLGPGAEFQAA